MVQSVPLAPRERFLALDVLRGAALFGILVMNMPSFSWTWWPTMKSDEIWPSWWDGAEIWVARWFFAGKFNSLFSFLFGIGFTLQLERLSRGGKSPMGPYLRKMGALALFGAIHAILIWRGDVLLTYVELGLLLLFVRRVPDRWILVLAAVTVLLAPIASAVQTAIMTPEHLAAEEARDAVLAKLADAAYAHGTYADATHARLRSLYEYYSDPWSLAWHGQMASTALLGCFAGRRGYLTSPEAHRPLLKRVLAASLATGILAVGSMSFLRASWKPHVISFVSPVLSALYNLQRPAIMIAYVSGFLLLATAGRLPHWAAKLAFAGRMPLTNYISQSIICTTIFYATGFGFYNRVGPAGGFAIAVSIYSVQVVWSGWWLRRFAFGPIEWLWRAMTYGHAPRMAIAPATSSGARPDGAPLADR